MKRGKLTKFLRELSPRERRYFLSVSLQTYMHTVYTLSGECSVITTPVDTIGLKLKHLVGEVFKIPAHGFSLFIQGKSDELSNMEVLHRNTTLFVMKKPPLTDTQIVGILYAECNGPGWRQSASRDPWSPEQPLEMLEKRICLVDTGADVEGNIDELRLDFENLLYKIPPELGDMGSLTVLHLNNNQLTGPIPPELSSLHELTELILHTNRLTGGIPPGTK
jgi:hypothetical protein